MLLTGAGGGPLGYEQAPDEQLSQALQLLSSALALIDQGETPSDIGVHIDRAISRVAEELEQCGIARERIQAIRNASPGSDAQN